MYLPVILCFLPLIALNLGFSFLSGIDLHWKKQEQKELAQQEVEALAAGSDFSYQFARRAGNFVEAFKSLGEADLQEKQMAGFLQSKSDKIFKWPFPDYDLFAFRLPEQAGNTELLFTRTSTRPSKRAFCKAFEHLVRVNRGEKMSGEIARQNEAMIAGILGGDARSDVMARTQRGRPTFAFYQFFPHWFMWDYFEIKGRGTFGFFLFSRSDESRAVSGKLLALRDLRQQNLGYGAFIPLFRGYGGAIYQSPLQHSEILKEWVKQRVSLAENDLKTWLQEGSPPVSKLGNYLAYSYLGSGQSHLAVLLMPEIKPESTPAWLFLVNVTAGGVLLLLLLRGSILGLWPSVNLRLRFTLTYLLAATLPVSMLLISAYGYVVQYRRAMHFQAISQLQFCIKQFDARKAQILDQYKSVFAEVVADEQLRQILKEKGSSSNEARERVSALYKNRPQPLPLLSFAIMDEVGEGARFYEGHAASDADPTFETFKYPLVSILRKKMVEADPQLKLRDFKPSISQSTSQEAYRSMSGNDLTEELDKRRSFPITRQVGASLATQMHELIKIDGKERYAIFIVWDDQALDVKTFKHSVDYFGLNNPEFIFTAYRVTPQGLAHIYKPDRHIDADFIEKSRSMAELASFRQSYASSRYQNLSLVAMPSKKYYKTIIAAGMQHFELEGSVSYRLMFFGVILLLALIAIVWCSYLSAKLFLDPITDLKSALDKVSAGQLDIEITSRSADEIGLLCHEFTSMARGLREREKLATLLSDHAIAALSKARDGGADSGTEAFSGVALVSDIRNFTGMCEQYTPDMVTDLLNEHFAQMTRVISESGGRIYKYIGDAVEAVFPENPEFPESAAERAFNAASLMVIRLMQINRQRSANNLFKYQIGVGLAYGNMFAGSIGSVETRLDYAIIGDPVKRAAILESCSVKNPAFPVVLDETIAGCLKNRGLKFEAIVDRDEQPAFILAEISGLPEASEEEYQDLAGQNFQSEKLSQLPANSRKFEAGSGSGISRFASFGFGVLFIALVVAGVLLGGSILKESRLTNRRLDIAAENMRLIEQIKCENAPLTAFENICRGLLADTEKMLNSGTTAEALPTLIDQRYAGLGEGAGRPSRTAIFRFAEFKVAGAKSIRADIAYCHGFSDSAVKQLAALSSMKRHIDAGIWNPEKFDVPDQYSRTIFGDKMTNSMFIWEFAGRAVEVSIDGTDEYFYYNYLFDQNAAISGLIMFSVPVQSIRHTPDVYLSGYATTDNHIVIRTPEKQRLFSGAFPADLRLKIENAGESAVYQAENYVITADSFGIAGKNYQVLVARKLESNSFETGKFFSLLIVAGGLLLTGCWYKVVTGTSSVNASVAAKLWLALLVAAVIPVITVYFVSSLYLSEDYNTRIAQEKVDLQRFIDLFELRDNFATPLGWKMVNDWTFASSTREIMLRLNNASGAGEVEPLKAELKKMTDAWHRRAGSLDRNVFNFSIRDIAVSGKSGWDFASSGIGNKEITQFGVMLQQIARNLVNRRNQPVNQGINSSELAGEIAVETGLQTVRALFGDDAYIRLSRGLGLPVVMNVLSGTAGIVIFPVPSIKDPDYIMVWMVMFDFEGYLSRVAQNYQGSYKILPVENHRYGTLVKSGDASLRRHLTTAASMIAASNLPVSGTLDYNGGSWLMEGRPGVTQMTSMLLAMAPEEPILKVVSHYRRLFNGLLILSLLLILFVARGVASDILQPVASLMNGMREAGSENYGYRIRIDRADELGALCDSFDAMMRGLEEKSLMGRMLSKTALKVTLKEQAQRSRKADYAFVYIGIPDFSTWLKGVPAEQMIADLRSHVAGISGIIISNGGDIDKIIGDKILATFNAERGLAAAAVAACSAARDIVVAENRSQFPFPVAVGVNLGSVINGFLGVGEKRDFTVIGDAVNVSARIEGQAEKLRYQRCLVSQTVYELVSHDFAAREHGEVELKGKSLPLKVYQLTI